MKFGKILVPYDGSENAKHAVAYAGKMAEEDPNAKIVAFASLAGPHDINRLMGGSEGVISYGETREALEHYRTVRADQLESSMKRLKEEVGEILGDAAADVEYEIDYSVSPVKGILAAIDAYGADMVVMGSRGKSAIAGMLGSVTFGVIRSAEVPVTVVK